MKDKGEDKSQNEFLQQKRTWFPGKYIPWEENSKIIEIKRETMVWKRQIFPLPSWLKRET